MEGLHMDNASASPPHPVHVSGERTGLLVRSSGAAEFSPDAILLGVGCSGWGGVFTSGQDAAHSGVGLLYVQVPIPGPRATVLAQVAGPSPPRGLGTAEAS